MSYQPVATRFFARPSRRWQVCRRQQGFTLIELIMVLVMLGVLAVFAAPRVFNRGDFEARGFHDQTLSTLRYAQKTAIAQRRVVCVAFTANTVTLARASLEASSNCDTPLIGARGEAVLQAPNNIAFTSVPVAFRFDGLGQPLEGASTPAPRSFQVGNTDRTITVEAVTGYVHD